MLCLARHLVLYAAVAGCVPGRAAPSGVDRLRAINDTGAQAPGTYQVLFCERSCEGKDSLSALVHGLVVLSDGPIDSAAIEQIAAAGDFNAPEAGRGGAPNACFHLHLIGERRKGAFVLGHATGIFPWTRVQTTGLVRAGLLMFVDAEYQVNLAVMDSGVVGVSEWFPHVEGVPSHPYVVLGKRIGPPDPIRCAAMGPADVPAPSR